ncbi:hypothetical protein [Ligilactobacillus salivarius]|uniref:hypothetical protein n=3 Tax=Ligilactobacillus salivarius TaxID=1624 RepID=UPI00136853D9|nr:hypothetical protein [Ligilactobacillus salivarius]MYY23679.1 hypothetical protein [Ligilactobacillus salivarius]MYY40777.1 hypothetical protein [Ligilactobacillus salivarius]
MHSLLGYSWAEIASILAVISVLFSGIYWLIRHGAKVLNNAINIGTYPLQQQFKELTNTIKRLNKNFEEEHEKLQRLEQEVEEHDKAIILHEEKIKRLEKTK